MAKGVEITRLYGGLFKLLSEDVELLNLLNIDLTGTPEEVLIKKISKIQKRRNPQNLAIGNLPVLSFYSPSGGYDLENGNVYYATFVFDVYTNDDINKAHLIHDRLCAMFDGEIPVIEGVVTFEVGHKEGFESITTLANTYCFTTILEFGVGIDV